MKYLNGSELAGYIKGRQASQVNKIVSLYNASPKLAIIVTVNDPVIEVYLRLKKKYGNDIGIKVELFRTDIKKIKGLIEKLNKDKSFHGIIIQLPVAKPDLTEELVNLVRPIKDVDGLGKGGKYHPATPLAILWLLSGFNVELKGKEIVIVGKGRLVGRPLERSLKNSGLSPVVIDNSTRNIDEKIKAADILITATGVPSLIKPDMLKQGATVIDAGVASENGKTVGDLDPKIYESRDDLTITPVKGGVGPLTICALFDNLLQAAENQLKT